jgi:sugar phosphate isomerase/epimerase
MTKQLKVALATHCLGQPLKSALLVASQLGATGVQLDARNEIKPSDISATGRRQFIHSLEEIGLAVASLDFPLRRPLWDMQRLDARVEALKQTMEFAYQLKSRTVTVRLGGLPDKEDATGLGLLQTVLNDLARHGNRVGVTLAIGQGREPVERLLEVLRSVSEGPIGINFDPAAAMMSETAPTEALQAMNKLITHVMVRDATRDMDGNGSEVPVGRGEVPWVEVLALLQEMDYRGWLTVDRTQGEDRAGDAGRAVQFLKSVYRG